MDRLTWLVATLALSLSLGVLGCVRDGGDGDGGCVSGATQGCICTSGEAGAQTCVDGAWSGCVCDGSPLCAAGETQPCLCADGTDGVQACQGDSWGACACDGDDDDVDDDEEECALGDERSCVCPDGNSGMQECRFGEWLSCVCEAAGPQVNDPCSDSSACSGGAEPMLCVFQYASDVVGICTVTCADWSDCTDLDGFWDCCDLSNGGTVCIPSDWGCE